MNQTVLLFSLLGLLVAAGIAGVGYWAYKKYYSNKNDLNGTGDHQDETKHEGALGEHDQPSGDNSHPHSSNNVDHEAWKKAQE